MQLRQKYAESFDDLFANDLLDVPSGFYNEALCTKDPSFLLNIFDGLMDQNLAIINKMQGT